MMTEQRADLRVHRRRASWARALLLTLAVAVVVRVVVGFVLLHGMPMINDAGDYMNVATRLAHAFPGDRPYYWPPGVPLLLAAAFRVFGVSVAAARSLTIAVDTLNVLLVFALALRLFGNARIASAAAWIAALYPPAVLMSSQAYSQTYAMACLLSAALAAIELLDSKRPHRAFVAGLALGAGCLVRPSMVAVAILAGALGCLAAVVSAYRRQQPSLTTSGLWVALAIAGVSLPVVPIMSFNAGHGAGWTISTNNDRNLWLGNNPYTPDYKTGHLADRAISELEPATAAYVRSFVARPDARAAMRAEAIRYVTAHPFRTLVRTANRMRAFWGFDFVMAREIQNFFNASSVTLLAVLAVEAGGYVLVGLLALAGLVACLRAAHRQAVWIVAIAGIGYTAPYALAFASGSYHFPVMGFLVPFAAAGLLSLVDNSRLRWPGRLTLVLWALFLAIQVEYAYWIVLMA